MGEEPTGDPAIDMNLFALRMGATACEIPTTGPQQSASQFARSKYPGHRELCRPAVSLVLDGQLEDTKQIDDLESHLLDSGINHK